MSNKLIDIIDITKSYDENVILDKLNLYIRENEFLTLLGPSGCGKTTLLRILGGFETPDSGNIIFDGRNINSLPPNRRQLNTVFQKYALFSHMSIAENIAFGLKIKGKSKGYIRDKIHYALKLVNLEGYGDRSPDSLSGGQQQRIAIARAIVNEPKVLLLDEPLGALDLKLRQDMQYELIRLKNELGITFVYVTHDQEEAMQVADRVVVMHNGRIEQADKPAEIWEHPKTRFVIEFLSDVNRIPAMISNGRLHVGTIDLALDGGADGRPVVDPKSIPDGPADLLLRPKDARMRRLEAEEDSAAAQKAGLLPVVIRSAVPKGGAIQVEAEPEGWYENTLNAYVLEDALPRLGRGYLMSFERAYLYRGEERLPVHVRKPRWPFVGEHGHEHSSPEAAEPPKALKHEAALFI